MSLSKHVKNYGVYQVMKKWLSYREQRVRGRALIMAEIMQVIVMARIILLSTVLAFFTFSGAVLLLV